MTDGIHEYKTKGACARKITFEIANGTVHNIQFDGGCNGNLKMISKLLEGMTPAEIAQKCSGNICGQKSTSCADQLARAMQEL